MIFEVMFNGVLGIVAALLLFRIGFQTSSLGLGAAIFYALVLSAAHLFIFGRQPILAVLNGFALAGTFTITINYLVARAK